jgi:phospholipid transport system substrate-binding protein
LGSVGNLSAASVDFEERTKCEKFVQELGSRAIEIINIPGIPDDEVTDKFAEIITSNFATDSLARFSLGKHYRTLSNAQKEAFIKCFIKMLVKFYASNFKEYKSAKFTVVVVRKKKEGQYFVETKVSIGGKKDVSIIWEVRCKNGRCKIYDAATDNISMKRLQQAEISGSISENGLNKFMTEFENKYKEINR